MKAKKITEPAKEIKEKISNIKKIKIAFGFAFAWCEEVLRFIGRLRVSLYLSESESNIASR